MSAAQRRRDNLIDDAQLFQILAGELERLGREIAIVEAAFEVEYGDAWREHIANKVMDPDDIPQRRDGESMADYRQRLETVLIATMIDENGNIRPNYANSDDPDVRRYAEWAKSRHDKNELDSILESTPNSELETVLPASRIGQSLFAAEEELTASGRDAVNYAEEIDARRQAVISTSDAELAAFDI